MTAVMVSNGFVGAGLWGCYLDLISFSWLRVTTQVYICCTVVQAETKQGFLPGKKNIGLASLLPLLSPTPMEAWLVGSTLPTMKGELPQWGLSYILSPSAAEKPLLEVK